MLCSYPIPNKLPRPFGFMVSDHYYLTTSHEVKKIHQSFQTLYQHRLKHREPQSYREKSHQSCGSLTNRSQSKNTPRVLSFRPEINPKSKLLAAQQLKNLQNAMDGEQPQFKIKIEDLLLSRGQVLKEKLRQKQEEREREKELENIFPEFTFSPTLLGGSKSTKQLLPTGQTRNVFDQLYQKAQTTLQKKNQKSREECDYERQQQQCTFKPDLQKTQRVNSKVESILRKAQKVSTQLQDVGKVKRALSRGQLKINLTHMCGSESDGIENVIFNKKQQPIESQSSCSINLKSIENLMLGSSQITNEAKAEEYHKAIPPVSKYQSNQPSSTGQTTQRMDTQRSQKSTTVNKGAITANMAKKYLSNVIKSNL